MKIFSSVFNYICETIGITVYDHHDKRIMNNYKLLTRNKRAKKIQKKK